MCKEIKENVKRVFMSYSWSSEEYKEKIRLLAEELISSGIDVVIDDYEVELGHDLNAFMERMVNDDSIDKVLILIDPIYTDKANKRGRTGVSTETQIISSEVYERSDQTKFIPVIMQKSEDGEKKIPTYLKSRSHIDLSELIIYNSNLEKLIRAIYGKPLYKKPTLGNPPSYLNDNVERKESRVFIDSFLGKRKELLKRESMFFKIFLKDIEKVREISFDDYRDYKGNIEKIAKATDILDEYKNSYVEFLEYYILSADFDIDEIIYFFEELFKYSIDNNSGIIIEGRYHHIEFLITELYIYTCLVLLEGKKYEDLSILLDSDYYIKGKECDFTRLRLPANILREKEHNRCDCVADLLISRTVFNGKDYKKNFINMDLLLFYISVIRNREKNTQNTDFFKFYHIWYPTTFFYADYEEKIRSLQKMKSKRHCQNMMKLFGLNSTDELKYNFKNFENLVDLDNYKKYRHTVPNINYHIPNEEIATKQ